MTTPEGLKYEGNRKDGTLTGQGYCSFPNGNKYVGRPKDGKPHGRGTFTLAYGGSYGGEWKNGAYHGKGTSTNPYGSRLVFVQGPTKKRWLSLETNDISEIDLTTGIAYNITEYMELNLCGVYIFGLEKDHNSKSYDLHNFLVNV